MKHLWGALVGALCVAGLTMNAAAQSVADKYPDKPIKIIVPFAPGAVSYTHLTLPTKRIV